MISSLINKKGFLKNIFIYKFILLFILNFLIKTIYPLPVLSNNNFKAEIKALVLLNRILNKKNHNNNIGFHTFIKDECNVEIDIRYIKNFSHYKKYNVDICVLKVLEI